MRAVEHKWLWKEPISEATLQDTAEGRRSKRDGEREREELSVHCIPDWLERGG